MLQRSFNPAKCKTALKLAVSRIKQLKNKKDAQIKQLKRELAQLLVSGHEQTARIRVEHVIREEKTMEAYNIVKIYCELIVASLQIIESQENCPINLKEAITSVIFASPRCADIPELLDVHNHFTEKYGKEFISSAVELHPDCGANHRLIENLSAKAPDVQTKIKILSAIVEEHKIKWDPKSFEVKDAKPPENLLNGPNSFKKASKINVEPPKIQAPTNCDQTNDVPANLVEHNVRSALSSQNFTCTDTGAIKTIMSGVSHHEMRPSGTLAEGMEFRHSYSGDRNAFPLDRQNWNMEFKDATSTARAGAVDIKQTHSNDNAAVVIDESSSDDDDCWFDAESELSVQESDLYFSSPGRKSPTHLSANMNTWSSRQTMSGSLGKSIQHSLFSTEGHSPPEFSESLTKSAVPSQPDGFLPVTFDDFDGPSSGSEEDMDKSKLGGITNPSIFSHKKNVYSKSPEPTRSESQWLTGSPYAEGRNSGSNREPWLHSSSNDSDCMEVPPDRSQRTEFNAVSQKKSIFGASSNHQPSRRLTKSRMDLNDTCTKSFYSACDERKPQKSKQSSRCSLLNDFKDNVRASESPDTMEDTELLNQSSLEGVKELNLGILTGGFRNKGFRHPPYTRSPSDASSTSKQATKNPFTKVEQSTGSPSIKTSFSSGAYNWKVSTKFDKKSYSKAPTTYFDSNDDNPEEELPEQTFRRNSGPYDLKVGTVVNDKSSSSLATYIGLDNDDSKEDLPNQTLTSKGRLDSGFSRRTKFSSHSEKSSYSNVTVASKASVTSDRGAESKPSTTGTLPMAQFLTMSSGQQENFDNGDSKEDLPNQTLTSISHHGFSRRTRASSRSEKSSYSNVTDESKASVTSFHDAEIKPSTTATLPMARFLTTSSDHWESLDNGDSKEDLPNQTLTSISRRGFSRRTKASSHSEKSSYSNVTVASEVSVTSDHGAEMKPSTAATLPMAHTLNTSSDRQESSDDGDSKEDLPNQALNCKGCLGSEFSRRTKTTSSHSEKNSYSKVTVESEASVISDYVTEIKPSTTATLPRAQSLTTSSEHRESSDNGDSEEDLTKQAKTCKGCLGSGFSRTKASPSHEKSSNSKVTVASEVPVTSNQGTGRTLSRTSNATETLPMARSQTTSSCYLEISEEPRSAEKAFCKPMPESMISLHEESLKSSAIELPSSSLPKMVAISAITSSSSLDAPSRENSIKKASHVHPKLPDYDTLTAHLESLRSNRKQM